MAFDEEDARVREDEDHALRPASFTEFVGQDAILSNLRDYIAAAKARDEPIDHILFSGMPGLGKTTLAHIVAAELGTDLRITSGPVLDRRGDLTGILTYLERSQILFIDEIHRLPRTVEEYLYSAMEDFQIDIVIDQGPGARAVRLELQHFTVIGATTREGLLSAPLRSRFGVLERLEPYRDTDLIRILNRSARLLGIGLDGAGATAIARRSRGTPRIANRFLRRIRDFVEARGGSAISGELAEEGLERLGVDASGLGHLDRQILEFLAKNSGQPVGLKTVAIAVGEEPGTLEDVYEPYLIRGGLITKTPRGRCLTPAGFAHLGLEAPPDWNPGDSPQGSLF